MKGEKVCEIRGNYMGYLDFNAVRYWDAREQLPMKMIDVVGYPYYLESDSRKRPDLVNLANNKLDDA